MKLANALRAKGVAAGMAAGAAAVMAVAVVAAVAGAVVMVAAAVAATANVTADRDATNRTTPFFIKMKGSREQTCFRFRGTLSACLFVYNRQDIRQRRLKNGLKFGPG